MEAEELKQRGNWPLWDKGARRGGRQPLLLMYSKDSLLDPQSLQPTYFLFLPLIATSEHNFSLPPGN